MKSLLTLWNVLATDVASTCSVDITRDLSRAAARNRDEGFSFFTITLPSFAKDFDRSLADEYISDAAFTGFARKGEIPKFLGGFLRHVFSDDGRLLDDPCIDCIRAVRQLCMLFGKVELQCTDDRVRDAFTAFVETEVYLEKVDEEFEDFPEDLLAFRRMAERLFSTEMYRTQADLLRLRAVPKHGPGATADRIIGNDKWSFRQWPERLEREFPYSDWAVANHRFADVSNVEFTSPSDELPVRVVAVPKTLKTPRIIAIEPAHMQYVQQAIQGSLRTHLLSGDYRIVGLRDQSRNQDLALAGSGDGSVATLDLSEASDRVSNLLVRQLFASYPALDRMVQACRSTRASVPEHGVIPLRKFASMGSALTFPVEAMVFSTIVFLAIEAAEGHRLSKTDLRVLSETVTVYGDDIIVPTRYASWVRDHLMRYGLLVNSTKSFWNGKFRESCGVDAYNGWNVTPVRVRRLLPRSPRDAQEFVSLVSLRNQLYKHGWWATVAYIDSMIRFMTDVYPVVDETSPVLGRHSFLRQIDVEGFDEGTQSPLVRGWVPSAVLPVSKLDGSAALAKCMISAVADSDWTSVLFWDGFEEHHLERHGRPDSVRTKIRWASPL